MIGKIIKEFFLGSNTTRSLIGRHRIISRSLVIRYFLAEFFGTFILVFFLLGSTLISLRNRDYVAAALGEGWAVMVGIYAVAHISGGHLNPAVTWAFFITGKMPSWLHYVSFSKLIRYPDGTFVGSSIFSLYLPFIIDVIGRVEATGPVFVTDSRTATSPSRIITLFGKGSDSEQPYTIQVILWGKLAQKPGWYEHEHPIIALHRVRLTSNRYGRALVMISPSVLVLEPHLGSSYRFKKWLDAGQYVEPIPLSASPFRFTENEYAVATSRIETLKLRSQEISKQFLITLGYVISQLVGAIVGAAMLDAVLLPQDQESLAATRVISGYGRGRAVLMESVTTFILVFVVFGTAVDRYGARATSSLAPFPIGSVVFMAFLVSSRFTGASLNPARSFGPAVIKGVWSSHWVYWVGPMTGATIAALVYALLFEPRTAQEDYRDATKFRRDEERSNLEFD